MGNKVTAASVHQYASAQAKALEHSLSTVTDCSSASTADEQFTVQRGTSWLVGWEVAIDGLGRGHVRDVLGVVGEIVLCLVELKDGRKFVVPTAVHPDNSDDNPRGESTESNVNMILIAPLSS